MKLSQQANIDDPAPLSEGEGFQGLNLPSPGGGRLLAFSNHVIAKTERRKAHPAPPLGRLRVKRDSFHPLTKKLSKSKYRVSRFSCQVKSGFALILYFQGVKRSSLKGLVKLKAGIERRLSGRRNGMTPTYFRAIPRTRSLRTGNSALIWASRSRSTSALTIVSRSPAEAMGVPHGSMIMLWPT